MNKNFLNKNQKRILYRNIGILFALTALCAVLARCGAFGRGETLEDLAKKQEQAAAEDQDAAVSGVAPSAGEDTVRSDSASLSDSLSATNRPEDTVHPDPSSLPKGQSASAGSAAGAQELSGGSAKAPSQDLSENPAVSAENASDESQEDIIMEDRITYQKDFYYESLSDAVKTRITGISYPADDSSAAISYDTLRYVRVLYYDFSGDVQSGELICHKAIAQDLVEIFYKLYEADYPIERICLVDEYQGDDESSMQDNNTSCFNYRALPSGKLSNHAYGLAIDLNPFYNPYVTTRKDGATNIAPAGSEPYADRAQDFAHKIDKEDLAYRLFTEHGFTWGGSWRSSKDYQHFEKAI